MGVVLSKYNNIDNNLFFLNNFHVNGNFNGVVNVRA